MSWSSDRESSVCALFLVVPLALSLGCGTDESIEDDEPVAFELDPDLPLGLALEQDDDAVAGTYSDELHRLRFRSETTSEGFELELELNGMIITARLDEDGVLEYDGFASGNGEPTQMTDDDRAAIVALNRSIEALGTDVSEDLARLRRFTSVWSEYPDTLDMHHQVQVGFRGWNSLCGQYGQFVQATHDDWSYNRGHDRTTYNALLSMDPSGPCSDGTYFWKNSTWQCFEPDHSKNIEYAYGSCFGRCGAGCGSDTQFTKDCLDHDSCVRFGHSTASFWCNDEFSSTTDDWLFAPSCL